MITKFPILASAAAAPPASADTTDACLAACVDVVCVVDSANGLPQSRHSHS